MQYFKHELTTRDDDRIFELIETHGVLGYGLWWAILEELYKAESEGFQICTTKIWFKRISKELNITDHRTLIRVLDTMAELGLIDAQLWAEHVIYAPGIEVDINERRSKYRLQGYRKHEPIVFERDEYQCVYCGATTDLTLDHVIPRSRGGSDKPENLVTACKKCNSAKSNKTPQEWLGGA